MLPHNAFDVLEEILPKSYQKNRHLTYPFSKPSVGVENKVINTSEVTSLQDRYLPNVEGYFSKSVLCNLLMNQRFTESS